MAVRRRACFDPHMWPRSTHSYCSHVRAQVLVLARSLFEKTDAVVRADNVARGIQDMLSAELPWAEERKRRARQLVCWYASMALHVNKTAAENVAVLQRHLDALAQQRRIML